MKLTLTVIILLNLWLLGFAFSRPGQLSTVAGRVLAFFALFLLPGVAISRGFSTHLDASKSTSFCLSCHVMAIHGESLHIDDRESLPAHHFQNRQIDRDHACYTCHTNYAMFGGVRAKFGGLRHLYVNYLGTIPDELELFRPYNNRECLHCHEGARSFEEEEAHIDEREALASNETSCLECHDVRHVLANTEGDAADAEGAGS